MGVIRAERGDKEDRMLLTMRRPNLSKRPGGDNSLPSAEALLEAGAGETVSPLPSSALLAVTRALAAAWSYCGVSGKPEIHDGGNEAGAPVEMRRCAAGMAGAAGRADVL